MLHPSYSDLMEVVNSEVEQGEQPVVQSRYSIVLATAKRARQIIAGDMPLVEEKEDYAKQVFAMDRDGKPRPRKDITMWSEVKANCAYMFDLLYYVKDRHLDFEENISLKDTKAVLEEYLFEYDHNMDKQAWFENMKKVARANGFAGEMKEYKENPSAFKGHITNVSTMVRVALTGSRQTPDLYEIQQVLGDARVRARLVETIRVLKLFIDKGQN